MARELNASVLPGGQVPTAVIGILCRRVVIHYVWIINALQDQLRTNASTVRFMLVGSQDSALAMMIGLVRLVIEELTTTTVIHTHRATQWVDTTPAIPMDTRLVMA